LLHFMLPAFYFGLIVCYYICIAIRVIQISNLISIQNSLQIIKGFDNRKRFFFP
jgi:hypothetical protein